MPYFDRFDICEAYYLYFCDWHNGQWSEEYKRLCKMQKYFKPSPLLRTAKDLTENGYEIYTALDQKQFDNFSKNWKLKG